MPFDERRLEIERLIGEVAQRHNVLLSPDDPIFMTVTLQEAVLDRALDKLAASIAASQDQIAAGTARHLADSKVLSERLVTAATGHMVARMNEATKEVAETIKAAVATELRAMRNMGDDASRARQSAWWAVSFAFAVAAIAATVAVVSPLLDQKAPACRQPHQLSAFP